MDNVFDPKCHKLNLLDINEYIDFMDELDKTPEKSTKVIEDLIRKFSQ